MKKTRANAAQQNETMVLAAATVETLLWVELWTGQAVDRRDDVQEDDLSDTPPAPPAVPSQMPVPPSAFAMVNDLLAVDGGQLQDSPSGSLSATFQDSVRAVNAARHLQRLVRGYSRASTAGSLHASLMLLHVTDAEAAANGAFSGHAQTGQVMCVGSLCDSIRSIPGLQFTNPPIAPSGNPTLSGTVLQLLPPVHMEGYVNEVYEPRVRIEAGKPSPVIAEPPQSRPPASSGELRPITVRSSIDPKVSGKMINPRWVIAAVAAVVVVGTILIFSPWLKNSSHPAVPQTAPGPAPTSQQVAPPAVGPLTPPVSPSPAKTHATVTIKQKDSAHSSLTVPSGTPDQADVATPRSSQHGMNFSSSEIEALIVRADKDSGNGAYDRAILEYRTVLSYDPSNALAKRGLAKAQYNKSHQ